MIDGFANALLLALALAMDATAVAAARGMSGLRPGDALRMASAFGGFQAGMAAVGWGLGAWVERWIAGWDHWLAFALLVLIGGKMLMEAARGGAGDVPRRDVPLTAGVLLVLAVATSIDALAAGVTLPVLDAPELVSIALIGAVTFATSLGGALGARWIGHRGGRALDALGGIALIAIGTRILLEDLW